MCCYSFWQVYSPPLLSCSSLLYQVHTKCLALTKALFCQKGLILCCCSFWQEYSPFLSLCLLSSSSPLYQVPRRHCNATLRRGGFVGRRKNFVFLLKPKVCISHLKYEAYQASIHGWMGGVRKVIGQRVVC